jgi:5-methylcytosine-specific restriction endonuclease McrA
MVKTKKARQLRKLWAEQGGKCWYCGHDTIIATHIEGQGNPKNAATLDHKIPKCRGGGPPNKPNKVMACKKCNEWKGAKTIQEFRRQFKMVLGRDFHGETQEVEEHVVRDRPDWRY